MIRGDSVVATTLLALMDSKWFNDEDRHLKRLMSYLVHHADLQLVHILIKSDFKTAKLQFSPDSEIGEDHSTTKAAYGMWLEIVSEDGERTWPIAWFRR